MSSLKSIVLTTDFSDCAKTAIPVAVDLAKNLSAKLYLVHVILPPMPYPSYPYGVVLENHERAQNHQDLEEKALNAMVTWMGEAGKNIHYERVILDGSPAERIVEYLKDKKIDLLVMGTHGYGTLKRFLLGSIANYLVHSAPCPVLTVKEDVAKN